MSNQYVEWSFRWNDWEIRKLGSGLPMFILRAVPTCTLWRWDYSACGWFFRPYPSIFVGQGEMARRGVVVRKIYD